MKCPLCWTEKAYLRPVSRWKRLTLGCLLLRPMKCQHCYHKFNVFWLWTIGKRVLAPQLRIYRPPDSASQTIAARHAATQGDSPSPTRTSRADAA